MAIKEGDFVKLEFTGKVKETGDIFDTTNEEIAMETEIFNEKKNYGPIPIIVGGNHLLKGLDEAIIGMEQGESKIVDISPEKGFGERDSSLVQLIPMKEFKKQGMKPFVGMEITLEGHRGKILTINGGRVRADFNHYLAGKILEFNLVISEILEDDEEKIKGLVKLHYAYPEMNIDKTEIKIEEDKLSIKLDENTKFDNRSYMDITMARHRIAKDIWENMDYKKVQFVDEFEKQEETKSESSEEIPDDEFSKEIANDESKE